MLLLTFQGGTVCVSGSRDHTLAVWDVENFKEKPLAHVDAHKAWIWRLAADSKSSFYSCSFDNTLKLWTLEEDLRSTNMYEYVPKILTAQSVYFKSSIFYLLCSIFLRKANEARRRTLRLPSLMSLTSRRVCDPRAERRHLTYDCMFSILIML